MMHTEAERKRLLVEAKYNVFRLDPSHLEFDLVSDVPRVSPIPAVRETGIAAMEAVPRRPDLQGLSEKLYGDARYVFMTMGRSAESALFGALACKGTVVHNGLFRTTQFQITQAGGTLERAPSAEAGFADVDLKWMRQRMAAGGVELVCLEACNNSQGGLPIRVEHLRELKALCEEFGAKLLIDATRLLSNCAYLQQNPIESAQAYTRFADAFWVSCAKELMVLTGSLVGVRDVELQRTIWKNAFEEGTELTIMAPPALQAMLATGMSHALERPEIYNERLEKLNRLADRLRSRSLNVASVGGHAVYVECGDELGDTGPFHTLSLLGLLFVTTGMRAVISPNETLGCKVMRVPVPIATYSDAELDEICSGLRTFFDRASEAPRLEKIPSECINETYFSHFAVAD